MTDEELLAAKVRLCIDAMVRAYETTTDPELRENLKVSLCTLSMSDDSLTGPYRKRRSEFLGNAEQLLGLVKYHRELVGLSGLSQLCDALEDLLATARKADRIVPPRDDRISPLWNPNQRKAVELALNWLNIPSRDGGPIRTQPKAILWLAANGPSTHADWGIGAEMDWGDDPRDAARKLSKRIKVRASKVSPGWEIHPENNQMVTIELSPQA